jgi:hypothetical protein
MMEPTGRDPSSGSRRLVPRLLLAIATALVGILALEAFSCAALRVSEGRWVGLADLEAARTHAAGGGRGDALRSSTRPAPQMWEGRILHPYLGYVMDPRLARPGIERAGLDPVSVELGFPRNRESVLQAPDPARAVIGIFGGSVADILSLSGADALRSALAEAPAFRGREIVLISLAAPGYKQPQALMALNYLLVLGAHFDAVLNLDGVNDLALPESELAPLGVAPFYPRGWYTRAADLSPELRVALGHVARLEELRRERARFFSHAPLRFSLTAGLTWSVLDRRLASRAAAAESALLVLPTGRNPQAQGPRLAGDEDVESRAVSVWRQSSLQMARLCESLGMPYFHFLQPNQYVPGSKPMHEEERRIAFREDSPMRLPIERGYARLREAGKALAAEGVAFTDLSEVFREVTEPVYIDDCCHLAAPGNQLLGAAIGRSMARAPALATTR